MAELSEVLLGAIAMASLAIGLFLLRFWHETRDRFFLLFALSFFVEGLNRLALALSERPNEGRPAIYCIRLTAYALILVAIVNKNLARPR